MFYAFSAFYPSDKSDNSIEKKVGRIKDKLRKEICIIRVIFLHFSQCSSTSLSSGRSGFARRTTLADISRKISIKLILQYIYLRYSHTNDICAKRFADFRFSILSINTFEGGTFRFLLKYTVGLIVLLHNL